jgi:hypothetical protein
VSGSTSIKADGDEKDDQGAETHDGRNSSQSALDTRTPGGAKDCGDCLPTLNDDCG